MIDNQFLRCFRSENCRPLDGIRQSSPGARQGRRTIRRIGRNIKPTRKKKTLKIPKFLPPKKKKENNNNAFNYDCWGSYTYIYQSRYPLRKNLSKLRNRRGKWWKLACTICNQQHPFSYSIIKHFLPLLTFCFFFVWFIFLFDTVYIYFSQTKKKRKRYHWYPKIYFLYINVYQC